MSGLRLPDISKTQSKNELPEISYNPSTKNSRPQSKHREEEHVIEPKKRIERNDRHHLDKHHKREDHHEHIDLAKVQGRHLKHRQQHEIPEEIVVDTTTDGRTAGTKHERIERAEQRERERLQRQKQREEEKMAALREHREIAALKREANEV